jgi:hypothetical protein
VRARAESQRENFIGDLISHLGQENLNRSVTSYDSSFLICIQFLSSKMKDRQYFWTKMYSSIKSDDCVDVAVLSMTMMMRYVHRRRNAHRREMEEDLLASSWSLTLPTATVESDQNLLPTKKPNLVLKMSMSMSMSMTTPSGPLIIHLTAWVGGDRR